MTAAPRRASGRDAVRAGRWGSGRERGSAVVEVALVGVPLLVPLVWVAIAVSTVQQAKAGVTDAARQAGRAYVTGSAGTAAARAQDVARQVLAGRGLPVAALRVRYAAPGSDCGAGTTSAPPRSGAAVAVCVTATVRLPGTSTDVTSRFLARGDAHRDYR